MIYTVIIFSFIFESIFTNIIDINSILIPLFTLVSLSLTYIYFKKKYVNFILVCGIVGIFYDIIFTNTLFINTITYILLSFLIIYIHKLLERNIVITNVFNMFLIAFYRIVSYLLLVIIGYLNFNFKDLLEGIYSSIIINVIYGIVMYIIIDKLSKILNIRT